MKRVESILSDESIQYDKEVIRPSKNLLSFYDKMESKYGTRGIIPKAIPKF